MVVTGCQENESFSKVLNFLDRLDDRTGCTHEETVAERERERQTDRQTDRQTETQRETETETDRDRDRQRQRDTERERKTHREGERERPRQRQRETEDSQILRKHMIGVISVYLIISICISAREVYMRPKQKSGIN